MLGHVRFRVALLIAAQCTPSAGLRGMKAGGSENTAPSLSRLCNCAVWHCSASSGSSRPPVSRALANYRLVEYAARVEHEPYERQTLSNSRAD